MGSVAEPEVTTHWTLDEASALPLTSQEWIAAWGSTLIVAPHPDDESLGCGGVIALLRALGHRVEIAVLTDGRHSHPRSQAFPPAKLIALRQEEVEAAAQILDVSAPHLHFLGLEDARTPPICSPQGERTVAALRTLMEGMQTVLVTWRGDPHCDHQAAYAYVRAAAAHLPVRVIEYPVWVWQNGAPTDAPSHRHHQIQRVGISSTLARKRAAIAAHRSQLGGLITDDPTGFTLPPVLLAHFLHDWELFIEPRR